MRKVKLIREFTLSKNVKSFFIPGTENIFNGSKENSTTGFTLIELIIVIFILSILASIAIPNFLGARNKARIVGAKDNLNTIIKGINMYYVEHGIYPAETTLDGISTLAILQEELMNPDNYLNQFYDTKIQQYKSPSATPGDSSPFEILIKTNSGVNREGKTCWLYYSEDLNLTEVWITPP